MNLKNFDKIFVLVSGGIDSTYLYEKLKKSYGEKIYPVNCFNPFETSKTLNLISKDPNFISIKPDEKYNYGKILKESFLKLPEARELRNAKPKSKYHKKIFPCCYHIKHKAFLDDPLFQEPNTIVISGIKRGDGKHRRIWLTQMANGTNSNNIHATAFGIRKFKRYTKKIALDGKPTFFHRHNRGQLYCYPYRDYKWRELPDICIRRLRKKYPELNHSGCSICPVLVLFDLKNEGERYIQSIKYASKLGI